MNKLNKLFNKSHIININDNSKIVIMSDCHRGSGDVYDNFLKNRSIYEAALNYYYDNNYTYIELGDGDDMWEVSNYNHIINEHLYIFKILKKFYVNNRLIMIYGNHDIYKRNNKILKKYFYNYYENNKKKYLFNNIKVYESLILKYKKKDIFLIHGHQLDIFNSVFWRLSKFLVRYIWKNLEKLGIKDPTGAVRNNKVTKRIEKKLESWSIKNNTILIAGHTHRALYPKEKEGLYFNDGSCVNPNGISCIEIENGNITLVKWFYKTIDMKVVSISRVVIDGNKKILDFYK